MNTNSWMHLLRLGYKCRSDLQNQNISLDIPVELRKYLSIKLSSCLLIMSNP